MAFQTFIFQTQVSQIDFQRIVFHKSLAYTIIKDPSLIFQFVVIWSSKRAFKFQLPTFDLSVCIWKVIFELCLWNVIFEVGFVEMIFHISDSYLNFGTWFLETKRKCSFIWVSDCWYSTFEQQFLYSHSEIWLLKFDDSEFDSRILLSVPWHLVINPGNFSISTTTFEKSKFKNNCTNQTSKIEVQKRDAKT